MFFKLVVGLGNPGRRYRDTWHNLGAMAVEELARRRQAGFLPGRGDFFLADCDDVSLMLPTSYMNRSGVPVSGWVRRHRVAPDEVLVALDDHDLPLGRIRLRPGGSSGGHRGLESIILELGSDQVPRLRIGVRTGGECGDLEYHILSKIPPSLHRPVAQVVAVAADAIETALGEGLEAAMNRYNGMEIVEERSA